MRAREVTAPTSSVAFLTRALLGALAKRAGSALPDLELTRRDITIDRAHLAAYNRVCGFRQRGYLSPTYPFVLAFPLHMEVITDAAFPFPVLGLVHLQNRIRQHRPIAESESLTLKVRSANLRPHDKGAQFDICVTLSVANTVVWESTSTILRRRAGAGAGGSARGTRHRETDATEQWAIAADTGRRYAAVSGDLNPIHLHAITARLFGFPRAIAHGMWTKARCLAALDDCLPESFTVDVQFKSPVLLPAPIDFHVDRQAAGGIDFGLADPRSGKVHLTGLLTPGCGD